MGLTRRLVGAGLGATALLGCANTRADPATDQAIRLLLPSASANEIALKIWLARPERAPPVLRIGGREVRAERLDENGAVWRFRQTGLEDHREYDVALSDSQGAHLREPWQIKTLPARGRAVSSFRIAAFTCAGGDPELSTRSGRSHFLELSARHALLERALSYNPDLVIANGDHIYWDQISALVHRPPEVAERMAAFYARIGALDPSKSAGADPNRGILTEVARRQIAAVYGERLARFPVVFVADDHDYFENDMAGAWGATFPPSRFAADMQRLVARLAYPEPLGRTGRGQSAGAVQNLRVGDLAEFLLYDCRRHLSMAPPAQFLDPPDEDFICELSRSSEARHLVHVPSAPIGWTAGKWAEWYPDRGEGRGSYGDDKDYWREGWFEQHQRLISSMTSRGDRPTIVLCGDIHASGAVRIARSGALDLTANPVHSILTGPLGTGDSGFPSAARGQLPWTPEALGIDTLAQLEERNGFTIVDIKPNQVDVKIFSWRPPEPLSAVAALEPRVEFSIERPPTRL